MLDLSHEAVGGQFDVVLFLGVSTTCDIRCWRSKVASVTRELAIVETEVSPTC